MYGMIFQQTLQISEHLNHLRELFSWLISLTILVVQISNLLSSQARVRSVCLIFTNACFMCMF